MSGEPMEVKRYDMRMAQVRVDDRGEWTLWVVGMDVRVTVFKGRHPDQEPFPGNELGHRLIGLGWWPDRRAMYASSGLTRVEKLALTELGGWRPSRTQERVWSIPVYREA